MTFPSVAIGDLAQIVGGGTPQRDNAAYFDGDIPWITPKDMKRWEITGSQVKITKVAVAQSATRMVACNNILIVVRSGILKHSLPIAINLVPVAINQDMKALICNSTVDPRYLARQIKANEAIILSWVRATTADNFPVEKLKQLEIPLPSLSEQRRIAAILDQADALRAKRRAALAHFDEMAQAIFVETFGDPATNSMKWDDNRRLGDVADIASGITKGRKLPATPLRSVPYLAVSNVQDQSLSLKTVNTIDASEEEIARFCLKIDDVVVTEGGDPDKLGRGSLWKGELSECIHQNHIFRIRVRPDWVHPLFVVWLIGSTRGKRYFLKAAKQTTGIASINIGQLRAFPILLPPFALQQRFADTLAKLAIARQVSEDLSAETQNLFASLQHRAFTGAL